MDINSMSYHVQKAVSREENIQAELLVIFLLEGRMTPGLIKIISSAFI